MTDDTHPTSTDESDASGGYTLSRRDALAALAAAGVSGAGAVAWGRLDGPEEPKLSEVDRATLVAIARTVYPSDVSGIAEFVETYVVGRVTDRPAYAAGVRESVTALDEYAETWASGPFRTVSVEQRDELLREMGVDVAEPDPAGSDRERVRYYLVNELLYALYTSPTGGTLVGIENPQGHPGGTDSYRRPPPDQRE